MSFGRAGQRYMLSALLQRPDLRAGLLVGGRECDAPGYHRVALRFADPRLEGDAYHIENELLEFPAFEATRDGEYVDAVALYDGEGNELMRIDCEAFPVHARMKARFQPGALQVGFGA